MIDKYLYISLALICLSQRTSAGLTQALTSVKDIGTGVANQFDNVIPKPDEIFDLGKQALVGLPFEVAADAINKVCTTALAAKTITPRINPDIEKMNFLLMTSCKNYSFPLRDADQMWKSPHFDPTKKIVIFATGWTNTINSSEPIKILSKPYFCRDDVNFIVVDAANFIDTLYTWSAFNTEEVGKNIAVGLTKLKSIVPIENVHLIGHSLGAHIVGYAGEYFYEMTGQYLPRITGLDPAKPCFKEGESLTGLLRGNALFIDVIHSNPGILGNRDPLGDCDFYPAGLTPIAPGTYSFSESHSRAVEYFAESSYPGNEKDFMATRCTSLQRVRDGNCKGKPVVMGFATTSDVKGNYFLDVNGEAPYGQGQTKEKYQENIKCGACPHENQQVTETTEESTTKKPLLSIFG